MTWPEVVDSAVKIGLGAVLTMLGARFSHGREVRRENTKRRVELILKAGEAVQAAHDKLVHAYNLGLLTNRFSEEVDAVRHDLYWAQSTLIICGADGSEAKISNYIKTIAACQNDLKSAKGSEGVIKALTTLNDRRLEILKALKLDLERIEHHAS